MNLYCFHKAKTAFRLCLLTSTFLISGIVSADRTYNSSLFEIKYTYINDAGQPIHLNTWKGTYVIFTMLYTNCRKICPRLTLVKLKEIEKAFSQRNIPLNIVIATLDPENDTPIALGYYRKTQKLESKNWHFLTGSESAIHTLASYLGLEDFYKMDEHIQHDFKIVLFKPDGTKKQLDWHNRDINTFF